MTTQYISAVNFVLSELNEQTLTAFSSAVGFHTFIIDSVQKAVDDVYKERQMWPFAKVTGHSERLVPGQQTYDLPTSAAHVDWDSFFVRSNEDITNYKISGDATGWTISGTGAFTSSSGINGINLEDAASMSQSADVIGAVPYRFTVRHTGGPLTITVGTSTAASNLLSADSYVVRKNEGTTFYKSFDNISASPLHVRLTAISGSAVVDYVSLRENFDSYSLKPMDFDEWRYTRKVQDTDGNPGNWTKPTRVFQNRDEQYGVTGVPDKKYSMEYDYWQVGDNISASSDLIQIPNKWMSSVYEGALMYAYRFRRDWEAMADAKANRKKIFGKMRRELIDPRTSQFFAR